MASPESGGVPTLLATDPTWHRGRTSPAIIDVVGPSGTGKSTVAPLLAKRLQALQPGTTVALERAEQPTSLAPLRLRLRALISQPRVSWAALTFAWRCDPAIGHIIRRSLNLAAAANRRDCLRQIATQQGSSLLVIEQGLMQVGWLYGAERLIRSLPALLRPAAVVELDADAAQRIRWRIERDRPSKLPPIRGEERLRAGQRVRTQLRAVSDSEEVAGLLARWGQQRCDPPLASEEIADLLDSSDPPSGSRSNEDGASASIPNDVAGTLWVRCRNTAAASPDFVASLAAERIAERLLP